MEWIVTHHYLFRLNGAQRRIYLWNDRDGILWGQKRRQSDSLQYDEKKNNTRRNGDACHGHLLVPEEERWSCKRKWPQAVTKFWSECERVSYYKPFKLNVLTWWILRKSAPHLPPRLVGTCRLTYQEFIKKKRNTCKKTFKLNTFVSILVPYSQPLISKNYWRKILLNIYVSIIKKYWYHYLRILP